VIDGVLVFSQFSCYSSQRTANHSLTHSVFLMYSL